MSQLDIDHKSCDELFDKVAEVCGPYKVEVVDFVLTLILAEVTANYAEYGDVKKEMKRITSNFFLFVKQTLEAAQEEREESALN